MKKLSMRIVSVLLSVVLLCSCVGFEAFADNEPAASDSGEQQYSASVVTSFADDESAYDYHAYHEEHSDAAMADADLILDGSAFTAQREAGATVADTYGEESNVLVWESQTGAVDYTFDVPRDALYNIALRYTLVDDSERDLAFGLRLDGEYPFFEADDLELPRMWTDASEFRKDDYGNEFAPEQKPYDGFVTKAMYDASGASVFPMEFFFTAGTHTVTIELNSEKLILSSIALTIPESTAPSYEEVKASYAGKGYQPATESIITEGETAQIKSTRSLIPYADNASPEVTPSSATKSYINYIGNTNWKLPNEEIKWYIDVPADGLYKLGVFYRQDQVINGFAYRHLRIDNETPFAECANLKFMYSIAWREYEFGDENGAYEFYLTAGRHEISLTGTMGEMAESYYDLKTVSSGIGTLYLDTIMITSDSPDKNRDYELFNTVPQFEERLQQFCDELDALVIRFQELSGEDGSSLVASLNNTTRCMRNMLKDRYHSQNYISDFYSQYTTLSSWLYSMQEMALCLDRFEFAPVNNDFNVKKVGFFENMGFGLKRFFISFSSSYSRISVAKEGSVPVRIWVNWGRDQAQVLNNLINESFVPYAKEELGYDVSVNLELVSADIIKGMLAHNAPDLTLHVARSTPVNYALRGALVDLSKFDDYEEVTERFGESASIPYEYNGGVYALPDQQSFYMMFYRTDIFKKLGLKVPDTWDEFLAVTAVLQRNNMNSYMPYTKASAGTATGVGGLSLFCSMLMQNGGSMYNDALNECLLDTPLSLQVFTEWTEMHTKYKVPVEASFYNRFRVGTMPIGICGYTQYTTLAEAAPEITNRWGIALVPGVQKEDGTIDRTISGSGTACSILHTCENQVEAWTFLKWWTSASTQSRYNTNVESILGTISRITTSNLEAFEKMGWERNDLKLLLEQRNWIEEVPEVPGSYYVSRSVDQAFWAVINDKNTPKDSLARWSLEANNEIKRKIAEYA